MAMKHYCPLITLLFLLLLTGCKKDPQEIYSEEKSGVVLICNEYYYDITLFNGEHLYFSGLDDDGDFINLTGNLDDIKKQPGVLNGTGFFIDEAGRILTNRHVVAPDVDKATVRNNVNAIIEGYAQYIQSLQDSMDQRYAAIQEYARESLYQDYYGETYTNLSEDEVASLQQEVESLKEQYVEAENLKNNMRRNIGSVAKVRGCLRGRANQNILPSGIRRKE